MDQRQLERRKLSLVPDLGIVCADPVKRTPAHNATALLIPISHFVVRMNPGILGDQAPGSTTALYYESKEP
jgi:hypothetical protein